MLLGYVQNGELWVFTPTNGYLILKRGFAILTEALNKLKRVTPLTEEDKARAAENKARTEAAKAA